MWRIKTTKDGIWLGRWILHSATQFHPFSTLPWDDQYPLFPGMTNTLYTIGPLIKVSERGKIPSTPSAPGFGALRFPNNGATAMTVFVAHPVDQVRTVHAFC